MDTLKDLLAQEMALKNAMAQLSSQMRGMQKSLAVVRTHIRETQNINRNALTYNLPNEILSTIFEAGHSQISYPIFKGRALSEIPFELLVSSVSHRWRDVALQTPRLWINLEINVLQSTDNLLDLYLYRSKISLLNIMFRHRRRPFNRDNSCVKNFKWQLERLIPHVARWRKFIMSSVYVGSLSTALGPLFHLHAPALDTLSIHSINEEQELVEIFSAGAPLLSSMVLLGAGCVRPPQGSTITFLQLGTHFSHTEFSQFVRYMPSLTRISMRSDVITDPSPSLTIDLPSILSLDIESITCSYSPSDLLRILNLPSVKTLTIRGHRLDVIPAFAQHSRSYPSIQSLKTISTYHYDWDVPVATKLHFISIFPNVQDITFQGADAFAILTVLRDRQPTDELLWPQLSAITIAPANAATALRKEKMWTFIVKIVRNRLHLGYPISQILLSSQIFECGSTKQQEWLRSQVALRVLEGSNLRYLEQADN